MWLASWCLRRARSTRAHVGAAAMRASRATIDKKKKKTATQQLGIEFVPLAKVRDWEWRGSSMHHNASVLCARLMKLGE